MAPGGQNALEIQGSVEGATHWRGIPFWIKTPVSIQGTGRVDACDTTLLMEGLALENFGEFHFGLTGKTTVARSAAATPAPGDWPGILFAPDSTGSVASATVSHADSALTVATINSVTVRDSTLSLSNAGLATLNSGAPLVERTAFMNCGTGVFAQDGAPDLGGGLLGSTGRNTLLGATYAIQNYSPAAISAQYNWWGCVATDEMDAGAPNITAIYDQADNPASGVVDYAGWLGATNRSMSATKENRDVVLSWPQEPTGTLIVFKGTTPQMMQFAGTTLTTSWRDPGALDNPAPLLFYRVEGPCP